MFERTVCGSVPKKHHIIHKGGDGALLHEECITQEGFEGPYTIAYHLRAPHLAQPEAPRSTWALPQPLPAAPSLARRHYLSGNLAVPGATPTTSRVPVLFNGDLTIGIARPDKSDDHYVVNADGDELFYIHEGQGTVVTQFGDLPFAADDYVFLPRGTIYRFDLSPSASSSSSSRQHWLTFELRGGLHIPRQWRNAVGQLRMDAPYCHRDFHKVRFKGPVDEGIRSVVVKRNDAFHGFLSPDSPLDVVGWDGSVYPWVFPILNFQPRAGLVHLPPTWHGTFATRGALICSFVPRVVDFHPDAIPCPYPHSSVDVDEFLFYCRGNFTSRRGVGPGSMSFHPAGIPHGPHPGAYAGSIGHKTTTELAVMLDCVLPLKATAQAASVEAPGYHQSFVP
ncbi:MAG: homogentisate 1,2-dioxygenase [Deltaproteobacteria bacterium]|nr:homogentisate 1,2-dioxygenase [Deltaproteobacteria bacterium]